MKIDSTTPGTAATGGPQGRPSLGMQIDEQIDPFALAEDSLPEIAPVKVSQSKRQNN